MSKKIKVVIPARYGSSRLPGKPLMLLEGKPMYWHVVQRVTEAGIALGDIVVATDDKRIVQSAINESIPVLLTSTEHVSGTDRINEVALLKGWADDVIVLNVQGDEPLIPAKLIADLAEFSAVNKHFSITTAVSPIKSIKDFSNVNIVKAIMAEQDRALYFTRSASPFNRDNQDDFSYAHKHIGIYAYKVSALREFCSYPEAKLEACEKLEQLRALSNGMSIGALVIANAPPQGVDTMEDFEQLKRIMESN